MQLIKKPEIDLVLKAYKGAARQEIEQKDRFTKLKTHGCLKELKTANFETQNPKMKFYIISSTSALSGNTCKVEEQSPAFLQTAKKGLLDFNLRLTENCLQAVTGQATEYCSCPLTPEVGN
ncbi:MAG: hypothetical protein Q8940_21270 [Bacteroidota bacterium]|nr:hypothetical protein [Bacteroidota bacterium]